MKIFYLLSAVFLLTTAVAAAERIRSERLEKAVAAEKFNQFSDGFILSLKKCEPNEEVKQVLFAEERVQILGEEFGKCHVKYRNFDLHVPLQMLPKITTFSDLQKQLSDSSVTLYLPEYEVSWLMFGLYDCAKRRTGSGSTVYHSSFGSDSMTITKSFSAVLDDDFCIIKAGNELSLGGKSTDYGKTCKVPVDQISSLLLPYEMLIDENKGKSGVSADGGRYFGSHQQNEQTQNADKELFEKLKQAGYCGL